MFVNQNRKYIHRNLRTARDLSLGPAGQERGFLNGGRHEYQIHKSKSKRIDCVVGYLRDFRNARLSLLTDEN